MNLKNTIYFFTLTDKDVIESCNNYDKIVIYSSMIRQILSLLLTFCVMLFGTTQLLALWQAVILSILASLIFFMIDQALIGSEWQLNNHHVFVKNRWFAWVNGFLNFIILLIKFTPRLIYSVIIALGLATLAELSIQSKAIDRLLIVDSKDNNREYFERLEKFNSTVDTRMREQSGVVKTLEEQLELKRQLTNSINIEVLQRNLNANKKRGEQLSKNLADYTAKKDELEREKETTQYEIKAKIEQITIYENEIIKEETDPNRGAYCGKECKKYKRKIVKLGREQASLGAKQKSTLNSIDSLNKNIALVIENKNNNDVETKDEGKTMLLMTADNSSLSELKKQLEIAVKTLKTLKDKRKESIEKNKNELKKAGFYENAEYDILDRYIGLNALHNDPKKGETAKLLSLGLKIFFMLLELSAVIVALFFSTRTVYAEKMRLKFLDGCEVARREFKD